MSLHHFLPFLLLLLAARAEASSDALRRGRTAFEQKEWAVAIRAFEEALAQGNASAEVFYQLAVAHDRAGHDLPAAAAYRGYLAAKGKKAPAGAPPDETVRQWIDEREVRVEGVGLRLIEDALRELDRLPASSAKVARGAVVAALARAGRSDAALRAASGGPAGMTAAAARAALELVQRRRLDRAWDAFRIAARLAAIEPTFPPVDHEPAVAAFAPPPRIFATREEEEAYFALEKEKHRKLEEERKAEVERQEAPMRPMRDRATHLLMLALVEKEAGFGGTAYATFVEGNRLLASSGLHHGRSPELLALLKGTVFRTSVHGPSCELLVHGEDYEPFLRRGDEDPAESRTWPSAPWDDMLTRRGPIDLSDPAFIDLPTRMRGIEDRQLEDIPGALADIGSTLLDAVEIIQHNPGKRR
jgi:hypothetical protein